MFSVKDDENVQKSNAPTGLGPSPPRDLPCPEVEAPGFSIFAPFQGAPLLLLVSGCGPPTQVTELPEPRTGGPTPGYDSLHRYRGAAGLKPSASTRTRDYTENDVPQLQDEFTLGLWKTNPWRMRVSSQSSVVPFR